jgi:hypothetical protein
VATALVGLIEEGVLGEENALEIARGLFYDNAAALYGLGGVKLKQ